MFACSHVECKLLQTLENTHSETSTFCFFANSQNFPDFTMSDVQQFCNASHILTQHEPTPFFHYCWHLYLLHVTTKTMSTMGKVYGQCCAGDWCLMPTRDITFHHVCSSCHLFIHFICGKTDKHDQTFWPSYFDPPELPAPASKPAAASSAGTMMASPAAMASTSRGAMVAASWRKLTAWAAGTTLTAGRDSHCRFNSSNDRRDGCCSRNNIRGCQPVKNKKQLSF